MIADLSYRPTVIDDSQPDRYDIDGRFADLCLCGAEKAADQTFCPDCKDQHDNLLARAVRHALPLNEAADVARLAQHVARALDTLPRCEGAFADVGCGTVVM